VTDVTSNVGHSRANLMGLRTTLRQCSPRSQRSQAPKNVIGDAMGPASDRTIRLED